MSGEAVLLSPSCPTGQHVGSVRAERRGKCTTMGYETPGQLWVPFPWEYLCGCTDPRDDA